MSNPPQRNPAPPGQPVVRGTPPSGRFMRPPPPGAMRGVPSSPGLLQQPPICATGQPGVPMPQRLPPRPNMGSMSRLPAGALQRLPPGSSPRLPPGPLPGSSPQNQPGPRRPPQPQGISPAGLPQRHPMMTRPASPVGVPSRLPITQSLPAVGSMTISQQLPRRPVTPNLGALPSMRPPMTRPGVITPTGRPVPPVGPSEVPQRPAVAGPVPRRPVVPSAVGSVLQRSVGPAAAVILPQRPVGPAPAGSIPRGPVGPIATGSIPQRLVRPAAAGLISQRNAAPAPATSASQKPTGPAAASPVPQRPSVPCAPGLPRPPSVPAQTPITGPQGDAPQKAAKPQQKDGALATVEDICHSSLNAANKDDLIEAYNQIFQGKPPKLSGRAPAGIEGREIPVTVNMFELQLPEGVVYHYDVEIFSISSNKTTAENVSLGSVPEAKKARCASTVVNRKVIEAFAKGYSNEIGDCWPAFDGRKNMYTRKQLPRAEHLYENVELEENGEKRLFSVRVRFATTVSFDSLHGAYNNQLLTYEASQDAVQAADIIVRTGPTLAFVPVGRSFFSPPSRADGDCLLGGGRETWFGFYSSIRLGSWKPLLNVDMSATAFYCSGPLLDLVKELLRKRSVDDFSRSELTDRDRATILKDIRLLKVTGRHVESRRQHRIDGLTRRPANQEFFEWEGKRVSVSQYFAEKYNMPLKFPNLPCVVVGKKNTMMPMEVCNIVPGQHCRRKLDEMQTAKMIRKTAMPPVDRFRRIDQSIKALRQTSTSLCKEFDLTISPKPMEVKARVLSSPHITFADQKKVQSREGVWKCDNRFLKAAQLNNWAIAVLGNVAETKVDNVIQNFQREGSKLGMKIAPPKFVKKYTGQTSPRNMLIDVKSKTPDLDLTLVMLAPFTDYGLLKAEAETTDLCMRTQCVKDKNVELKFNPMFAVNLLQKINTKLGGYNNGVYGAPSDTMKKPYMAIGMDVNHPGPTDANTPSVAAMVASMDRIPSQYHACTSVQLNRKGNREENIVDTENMFLECITKFHERNNVLPHHIFIFRDGVSEQQFSAVRMYELGAIRKACLRFRPDYTPTMTFIVVQKRHHVRLMPSNERDGVGRPRNVPPGTVVDTDIVNPGIFDFYLCSQQGIQGTSRPAHYHVVHDDAQHSSDEIYKICYYLCHTYARCSRSVSIPAPAYYAHLAAFRAKEHLKGKVLNSSSDGSTSNRSSSSQSSDTDLEKFQVSQRVSGEMRTSMYFV